jgi:hypothetical protein
MCSWPHLVVINPSPANVFRVARHGVAPARGIRDDFKPDTISDMQTTIVFYLRYVAENGLVGFVRFDEAVAFDAINNNSSSHKNPLRLLSSP